MIPELFSNLPIQFRCRFLVIGEFPEKKLCSLYVYSGVIFLKPLKVNIEVFLYNVESEMYTETK